MPLFSELLNKLPKSKETRMSAQGYALWISWQGDLDPAVIQTLQNYGGMYMTSDREQALWFFFNTDVFLALARLYVWARFNPITVTIQLLQARFQLGVKREIGIDIESILEHQESYPHEGLELWIHHKAQEHVTNVPGISLNPTKPKQGMANAKWTTLEADTRLPYTSSQGWYAILKPLGNPLDKNYQHAWPVMQQTIANTLKQNRLKFIVQDDFIMVLVDNLLLMRTWLRELLRDCENVKNSDRDSYWPFVSAIVERKGLNFSGNLYKKVGLQWEKLTPDFPYLSYRTAYLLGTGFAIQDLGFSDTQSNMDSWCTVMLDEGEADVHFITILMPSQLMAGDLEDCFFCGINTHASHECPTRNLQTTETPNNPIGLGVDKINESFKAIEKTIAQHGVQGYDELLNKSSDTSDLLLDIFEINFPSQLRAMPYFWINRGRELGKARDNSEIIRDEGPVWDLYDKVLKASQADFSLIDSEIKSTIVRAPRDPRIRTLHGFLYVLRQDYTQAAAAFKEAATLTPIPALQAWNEYLQARIAEVQGDYIDSIEQYDQTLRVVPQWRDIEYRKIVCNIKMGFGEQVLGSLSRLIHEDASYFNRCIIDPELGRGQNLILSHLQPLWIEAEKSAFAEKKSIQHMSDRVKTWFPPSHPSHIILNNHISELNTLAATQNYMAFLEVTKRRPSCQKEIEEFIKRQIEELQARYKVYLDNLQKVRDEAAWFPFPKILREFSREFNEAAGVINWAFASNFHDAVTFGEAQKNTEQVETLLRSLQRKLNFLRTVRDGTLFGLTLTKTFIWLEAIGLTLCFLGIPAIIFFGDMIGLGWLRNILASQQWEIQKILFGIITIISLGVAALRATILFDIQKDKLLNEAREQRERLQNDRLERIRKKRQIEKENRAKEAQRIKLEQQRLKMSGQS